MPLVRSLARPMLATPFIFGGLNQLQNADKLAPVAAPTVAKIAEQTNLPNDVDLLVKANGAAMVAGGAAMALGVLPRLTALGLGASLVPTTLAAYSFWEKDDPGERAKARSGFVTNLGLLGGLVLAAVDTEGRPGALYRLRMAGDSIGRTTRRAKREARFAARAAKNEARLAVAHAKDAIT